MTSTINETYDLYLEHADAAPEIVRGVTDIAGGDGAVWYTDAEGQRVGVCVDAYVVMASVAVEGGAR